MRVDRIALEKLRVASAFPAAAGNLVLWLGRRWTSRRMAGSLEVSEHVGPFGEGFSHLDAGIKKPDVIRARRRAPVLNWRHREHPLPQYEVLTARSTGGVKAS